MKKKLEAELISIAHRILKLKNRAELDQLQQETLKLYEKISVLKFVEDNFADVQPTIGYASAEVKLEEIYDLEPEQPKADEPKKEVPKEDKKSKDKQEEKEAVTGVKPEEETAVAETEEQLEEVAETEASQEEVEITEEPEAEEEKEEAAGEFKTEEPGHKIEVEKTKEELTAMEDGAVAVFEKEQEADEVEEEEAADAEVITIEPDKDTKVEDSNLSFDFAFERPAAPEEPKEAKKEITFEDFHLEYKEPEFVKKSDMDKPAETQKEEPKEEIKPVEDVKSKEEVKEAPKEEAKPNQQGLRPEYAIAEIKVDPEFDQPKPEIKEEPKAEEPKEPEAPKEGPKAEEKKEEPKPFFNYDAPKPQDSPSTIKSINDSFGKIISLGLNDRIAFEKHLFGGSADDLNRVLSQLNTVNSYDEAKQFIDDLVKPDYNNWQDKEEYEERFMQLVEKKFN